MGEKSAFFLLGLIFTILGAIEVVVGTCVGFLADWGDPIGGIMFFLIMGGVGAIFLILGIVLLVKVGKHKNMVDAVVGRGDYITAEIVSCELNRSVEINGRNPHYLVCRYVDEVGQTHLFQSDNFMTDLLANTPQKEVRVYVDFNDFNRYHVDIESLTGRIIEHKNII